MKKKGSFLSGLIVFILIVIILGGVGYLGFNVIRNANGMAGMSMASDTSSSDTNNKDSVNAETEKDKSDTTSDSNNTESPYKISQVNKVMSNKETLDAAYETIDSALKKMTLDPYAAGSDTDASKSENSMKDDQSTSKDSSKSNTTVNIYNGDAASQQMPQMQSMGKTYDATKMQQLHSGLYKVSVGMQLLEQLQDSITAQMEQANIDSSSEAQYYINQYNTTIQMKNKLNSALTDINDAVDLININPYVDANGLVYDAERMTQLHDSIYQIADGVVGLDKLNDDLLNQSLKLGTLAQNAYNSLQSASQNNSMNMSNMSSGINVSGIINIVLIVFVVIFIIGLLGSIMNLFKSGGQRNSMKDSI